MSFYPGGLDSQLRSSECLPPSPEIGTQVVTACGGTLAYCATTPCIVVKNERILFCLAVCKESFVRDPDSSCVSIGPYRWMLTK